MLNFNQRINAVMLEVPYAQHFTVAFPTQRHSPCYGKNSHPSQWDERGYFKLLTHFLDVLVLTAYWLYYIWSVLIESGLGAASVGQD
jgi:hypothetical protein